MPKLKLPVVGAPPTAIGAVGALPPTPQPPPTETTCASSDMAENVRAVIRMMRVRMTGVSGDGPVGTKKTAI